MIRAEAHSDDRVHEVNFDATPYFQQAKSEEIAALAACDWGGDYPADAVAQFCAEHEPKLAQLFSYLESIANVPSKKDESGFECHVTSEDALAWLKTNRPELHDALTRNETSSRREIYTLFVDGPLDRRQARILFQEFKLGQLLPVQGSIYQIADSPVNRAIVGGADAKNLMLSVVYVRPATEEEMTHSPLEREGTQGNSLLDKEWEGLPQRLQEGMAAARENPGRYGGRYVGRRYDKKIKKTIFMVLDDDDPDLYRDDEKLDILAQCMPHKVHPIGRARHYIKEDGSVSFD